MLIIWLDLVDIEGCTPVHVACTRGALECVQMLLRWNAPVTTRDISGATPAHAAAASGQMAVLRCLLLYDSSLHVYYLYYFVHVALYVWY